jgi:hypothetical protein
MMDIMGFVQTSTIIAREPRTRFAFRDDRPDGTFMAFEYLLEDRDGGSTGLRFAHSGMWSRFADALVADR